MRRCIAEVTPGPYVLVAVSDTGDGHAARGRRRRRSIRSSPPRREGKGTGLGLSMVYGFVHQSNGHIRIDSAIGQGTSVKLYLPRTLDPWSQRTPTAPATRLAGSERVLVVEDNDDVRRAVRRHAVRMGLPGRGSGESRCRRRPSWRKDPALRPAIHRHRHAGRAQSAIELGGDGAAPAAGDRRVADLGLCARSHPGQDRRDYPMIAKPYRGEELGRQSLVPLLSASPPAPPHATTSRSRCRLGFCRHDRAACLLVEDEVVLRMSTTDMLERLDCVCRRRWHRRAGARARCPRASSFDLLLTDLGLPGMSGRGSWRAEVHQRFPASAGGHCQRLWPHRRCRGEGIRFISKPYSSVDLRQALDHAGARRGGLPDIRPICNPLARAVAFMSA